MERRREVRVNFSQPVRVTALDGSLEPLDGQAVDLSGRGIRVLVPAPISPGEPVKIELEDALLLGETCFCQRLDSGFMIGVEVDQALRGLADLACLNRALLGERAPALMSTRRVILLGK
jgi:hypothetical protein